MGSWEIRGSALTAPAVLLRPGVNESVTAGRIRCPGSEAIDGKSRQMVFMSFKHRIAEIAPGLGKENGSVPAQLFGYHLLT